MFEDNFNGPTSAFVASFIPELFICLLVNSQCEQTIVLHTTYSICKLNSSCSDIHTTAIYSSNEPVRIPNKKEIKEKIIIGIYNSVGRNEIWDKFHEL